MFTLSMMVNPVPIAVGMDWPVEVGVGGGDPEPADLRRVLGDSERH